jgi:hypothetical protein
MGYGWVGRDACELVLMELNIRTDGIEGVNIPLAQGLTLSR